MSDYSDTMQSYLDACDASPPIAFPLDMTFSLGIPGPKLSAGHPTKKSPKTLRRSSTVFKSPEFGARQTYWYILPEKASLFAKTVFDFAPLTYSPWKGSLPYSYWSAMCLLVKYKEISAAFRKSIKSITIDAPASTFPTHAHALEMRDAIHQNACVRWQMKRLILGWRLKRLRASNTEDVMTGCTPVQGVDIVDWATRSKYTFEAATLYKDICSRLYLSDQQFPTPKPPRNMFTNEILTYGQLFSALKALEGYGFSCWATKGFKAEGFSVKSFERVYTVPLKKQALKTMFANRANPDYIELMMDFIEFEYDYHGKSFSRRDMWRWMIQHQPDWPLIQSWRKLCYKYYLETVDLGVAAPMGEIHHESADMVMQPINGMILTMRMAARKGNEEARELLHASFIPPETETQTYITILLPTSRRFFRLPVIHDNVPSHTADPTVPPGDASGPSE
jgi:hypothetical protein